MKEPHIYFKDQTIKCSICGNSEKLDGEVLQHFKTKPFPDKNIVNPTIKNFHPDWNATCLKCNKQTQVCQPPYLYY